MDIVRIMLGGLRQVLRGFGGLLRTVPLGWLMLLGTVALPIVILSILVVLVFFILLLLLAILGVLFYLLVVRPVFGPRRRRVKVIEAEYTVKSDDQ